MSKEICIRCKEEDYDRRMLVMRCSYAMEELSIPFTYDAHTALYTMIACKSCRADWLSAISAWFHDYKPKTEPVNSGIFIRRNGEAVEISREEWDCLNPGREPVIWSQP